MVNIHREEHPYNTSPRDYAPDISGVVRIVETQKYTPSKRVVLALQRGNKNIQTKGFRRSVTEAIFDDAIEQEYPDDEYRKRFLRRLHRWSGKNARNILLDRSEILETWRTRDGNFIPDAYLIDKANRTVVCYEVEDQHPLNASSIGAYGAAWWTLEYIYWGLHLVAYDIYGNYRIVNLPESEFLAHDIREARIRKSSERAAQRASGK